MTDQQVDFVKELNSLGCMTGMDWLTVGVAAVMAIGISGTALIVAFRSMKS